MAFTMNRLITLTIFMMTLFLMSNFATAGTITGEVTYAGSIPKRGPMKTQKSDKD